MLKMKYLKIATVVLCVTSMLALARPVMADGDDGGDTAWTGALDENGNFTAENLEYLGMVVDYNAAYMQGEKDSGALSGLTESLPPAQYLAFYNPANNVTYMIPDAVTAQYMALNADVSPVGDMIGAVTTSTSFTTQLMSNSLDAAFSLPFDFAGTFLPAVQVNGEPAQASALNLTYVAGPQQDGQYQAVFQNSTVGVVQNNAVQESGSDLFGCLTGGGQCLINGAYTLNSGYELQQELSRLLVEDNILGDLAAGILGNSALGDMIANALNNQQMTQINQQLAQAGWECEGTTCLPTDPVKRQAYLAYTNLANDIQNWCAQNKMSGCDTIIAVSGNLSGIRVITSIPSYYSGPTSCAADKVIPGQIKASARLVDPPYPLVVGQDDAKRGSDLEYRLEIYPTILRTWKLVKEAPIASCETVPPNTIAPSGGCPEGQMLVYVTRGKCVSSDKAFPEGAQWSMPTASLEARSRDWILNVLSTAYPGAYLHHPDWSWPYTDNNCGFQGSVYVCIYSYERVQTSDPGWYGMAIQGETTGTAVSRSRRFNVQGGEFSVWLMQTAIIH
jgi:hypothetical protein